jgi:peptidoglycan/LPS O-acetylase OafA/YrhL
MAVGGIIAYSDKMIQHKILSNISSILGLSSIFITIWYVNEDSLFPGYWALIPTIGAALIIIGGPESLSNKYLLSTKVFVFIGKISYPLYLWHWPLLVYSRMMYPSGSTSIFAKTWIVVLISLLLSIFTYFVIEKPLRFRKSKVITYLLVMTMLAVGTVALFGINKEKNN